MLTSINSYLPRLLELQKPKKVTKPKAKQVKKPKVTKATPLDVNVDSKSIEGHTYLVNLLGFDLAGDFKVVFGKTWSGKDIPVLGYKLTAVSEPKEDVEDIKNILTSEMIPILESLQGRISSTIGKIKADVA